MSKTILLLQESPGELFEYARWDGASKAKFHNQKSFFERTDYGDGFHGKQSSVYNKYIKHDVKQEASLIGEVIGELNTLDFDETKWMFAQRLTEGDSVDVGRYLDGQERCWCGVRRKVRPKKCVRIYASLGGHCGRSPKELSVNGALAVTLCEILESTGAGVELWDWTYLRGISQKGSDLLHLIRVKSSSEFSDLGMINYITGNDKVFRNTCFRDWCRKFDEAGEEVTTGLGRPSTVTKEQLEGYDDGTCDGVFLIPPIYDVEEAKRWLVDTIKELKKQ